MNSFKIQKLKKLLLLIFSIILFLFTFSTYKIAKQANKFSSRQISSKYPEKVIVFDKYIEKYKPETKTFATCDNVQLSGLLFYNPNAKRTILIVHGYRASKEFLAPLIDLFHNDNIFIFDLRAHGNSGSNKITFGNLESYDIKAAMNVIVQDPRISNLPIYGIGLSMGAASLIKAAFEFDIFKGLILDSGYANFKSQAVHWIQNYSHLPLFIIKTGLFFYQFFYDAFYINLDFADIISKIKIPILIIHSNIDKVTPVANAYELFNKANNPKELWTVNDAKHALIFDKYPQEYKKKIEDFFNKMQ